MKVRAFHKLLSLTLIIALAQALGCSALCATGAFSCCNKCEGHSCCRMESSKISGHRKAPAKDCQKEHQTFISNISKSAPLPGLAAPNCSTFLSLVNHVDLSSFDLCLNEGDKLFEGFFYPPPDIRHARIEFRLIRI